MTIKSNIFSWICNDDEEQCKWATQYLKKNDIKLPCNNVQIGRSYNEPLTLTERIEKYFEHQDLSTKKDFVRKMKQSWRKKKSRIKSKKNGDIPYNFTLDKTISNNFNSLTKKLKMTQKELLSYLISSEKDYINLTKQAETEIKHAEIKIKTKDRLLKLNSNVEQNKKITELEKELNETKNKLTLLQQELNKYHEPSDKNNKVSN